MVDLAVLDKITVFNGGGNAGKIKLLIHTFLTVPVPAAIVTQATIKKKGSGVHTIILFKNEAREPGARPQTSLSGGLAIPCQPKG